MYLGIDIGGSKTLVAAFSPDGEILKKYKFATSPDYSRFLIDLQEALATGFHGFSFRRCCCAAPGLIDRSRGIVRRFGNLKWVNVPLRDDVSRLLGGTSVIVENDSKLAGLSEAILVQDKYKKVLYVTIGTGISDGVIINGKIDKDLADSEAGQMAVEHDGKLVRWEDVASGRAIVRRFGKKAAEIDDPAIWTQYVQGLAKGIDALVAIIMPEVVIIGGGVGAHFEKFGKMLEQELARYENDMIKMPPIQKAVNPEEAVIHGCYEYLKQEG